MPPSTTIPAPSSPNGSAFPTRAADKRAEVLSGGVSGLRSLSNTFNDQAALSRTIDDAQLRYGDGAFDAMLRNPVVGASVDVLRLATLSNDVGIVPAVRTRPGRPVEDPRALDTANRAADLCAYCLDRLEDPIVPTLFDLSRAMAYGASLAEEVWDIPHIGPQAGKLVLKAIIPKPRRAWSFVVDPNLRVLGIVGSGVDGRSAIFPREKFAVLTWGKQDNDPRGTSILGRIAEAWNFLTQLPAPHFLFVQRWGQPATVIKTANGDQVFPDGRTRHQAMLAVAEDLRAGKVASIDPADDAALLEPKTDGQVYERAYELKRREIVLSILLQTRATMEAQFGSKADSQTGQDVLGNLLRFTRRWVARFLEWEVFYRIVLYNMGAEAADSFTPKADLGSVEHQDITGLLGALGSVGYELEPSQFPEIDAAVSEVIPIREVPEAQAQDVQVQAGTGTAGDNTPDDQPAEAA